MELRQRSTRFVMKIQNKSQILGRFALLTCGAFVLAPVAHSDPARSGINMPVAGGASRTIGTPSFAGAPRSIGAPSFGGVSNGIGAPNSGGAPGMGGMPSLMRSTGRSSERSSRTRVSIDVNIGGGRSSQGIAIGGYGAPYNYGSPIVLGPGYYGGGYGGGGVTVVGNGTTVINNSSGYAGYPGYYGSPYYGSYYYSPYRGVPVYRTSRFGYPTGGSSPIVSLDSLTDNYGYYPNDGYYNGGYYNGGYYNGGYYNGGYYDAYNGLPASAYYNPAWGEGNYYGGAPNWNLPDAGYYYDPDGSYYGGMSASSKARRSAGNRGTGNRTNADQTKRSVRDARPNVASSEEAGDSANGPAWAGSAVWSANADGTPATIPTWPSDTASATK